MNPSAPSSSRGAAWLAVAAAVAVGAASLRNGFAYDDVPVIVENARVTTLVPPWEYFGQPYWPGGGLYRPLTVWLLALLWKLGAGAPWIFHAVNVTLHALATGLVYRLARHLLAAPWAMLAALLFAVHPVHVEAVANVVGVSELLCTSLVLASVLSAMRGVVDGFTPARRLAALGFGMLAALSKEQGFVTPALVLVTAVAAGVPPAAASARKVASVAGAMAVLLAGLLILRASVLGGWTGDEPAAPLRALTPGSRMLVSLGTVPDWARLLLWPARLSFDYSPPGHVVASTAGPTHLLGLLLLGASAWLAWKCRARMPAVTLGVAWTAIALLPISNLIVPTGILLAERTLYLASAGAMLAVAGLFERAWYWLPSRASRRTALAITGTVALVAAWRSAARAAVWRDNDSLLRQVAVESPDNYRARRTLARHLDRQGRLDDAAREYRRSIALWGNDPKVYEDLAILLDREGRGREAVTVLHDGLAVDPAAAAMRSKLYFLEATQGDWVAARATASTGLAQGDTMFMSLVQQADSALAAPSGTPTSSTQ